MWGYKGPFIPSYSCHRSGHSSPEVPHGHLQRLRLSSPAPFPSFPFPSLDARISKAFPKIMLQADLHLTACFPGNPTTLTLRAQPLSPRAHTYRPGGSIFIPRGSASLLSPHQYPQPDVSECWLRGSGPPQSGQHTTIPPSKGLNSSDFPNGKTIRLPFCGPTLCITWLGPGHRALS